MRDSLKRKIDDPIFALSVHGTAGVWGTLSTGFFATPELAAVGAARAILWWRFGQLGVQILSVVTAGLYTFIVAYIILAIIKKMMGIRVTEEEEIMGLDISEHGSYGYPEAFTVEKSNQSF